MKAVVYHADSHFAWGPAVGHTYRQLFKRFLPICHQFDMEVIHLTLDDHPGWGDRTIHYGGMHPHDVTANREECFVTFLESAPDDVYWFCEPDYDIMQMWPPLTTDCAMLYREQDDVPMSPAWRLATKKALPFFVACRDAMRVDPRKDWHGDSAAFTNVWHKMGAPVEGDTVTYLGVTVEFRKYAHYIKGAPKYCRNWLGPKKLKLI